MGQFFKEQEVLGCNCNFRYIHILLVVLLEKLGIYGENMLKETLGYKFCSVSIHEQQSI